MNMIDYLFGCFLIFVAGAFLSPLIFSAWIFFEDKRVFKELKKVRQVTNGQLVQIIPRTFPDQRGFRNTIPLTRGSVTLILRGRGFDSVAVAYRLTVSGSTGMLWETMLKTKRLGWLESDGLIYWGFLSEKFSAPPGSDPQSFGGA